VGQHNPSDNASATQYGTLQSDGGTYEIWQKERTNAPSIIGDNTNFQQYWSIRTKMHCGGTINTGNHFRAWAAAGLPLGKQNYMVMGIEGQQGAGSADITIGVSPTTKVPETTTSTYRSIRRTTTRKPTSIVFSTSVKTTTKATSVAASATRATVPTPTE
jgi:endo-1,4-beta-xylanase